MSGVWELHALCSAASGISHLRVVIMEVVVSEPFENS